MPSSTPRSSSAEDSCPAPAASAVQTAPASTAHVPASTADYRHVELALLGLSCANCANHVQRTLNKLEGVECMVNFATESASLEAADSYSAQDLIEAVKGAGYDARLPVSYTHLTLPTICSV